MAGKIRPKLGCADGTSGCSGNLLITAPAKKHRTALVAAAYYSVRAGTSQTLTIKLSAKGRALLAVHPKGFTAQLRLTPSGGKTSMTTSVTIKRARGERKKK